MPLFGPPDVQKLVAKGNVKGLIKALGYPKDASIRQGAAEALGQVGDPQAVTPLIVAFKTNQDSEMARVVADALIKIGVAAVEPLGQVLRDQDASVRRLAVEVLGEIGDAQAAELLFNAFTAETDSSVRMAAGEELVKVGAAAIEPLAVILKSPFHKSRRRTAIEMLGNIGDVQAVKPLIAAYKKEKDGKMHKSVFEALVKIGEAGIEPLGLMLKNKDESVRRMVVYVLETIGDPQALKPLVTAFETDKDSTVRQAAAGALVSGRLASACDHDLLLTLLRNRSLSVRQKALQRLEALGWVPAEQIERATCWIVNDDLKRLSELDFKVISPLLIESLSWHFADAVATKGQIAVLLVRHGMSVEDPALQPAIEELRSCADESDTFRWDFELTDQNMRPVKVWDGPSKKKTAARALLKELGLPMA